MYFHFHQKPRFYGQRAFTLLYVTHVSIISRRIIASLDHYQAIFHKLLLLLKKFL